MPLAAQASENILLTVPIVGPPISRLVRAIRMAVLKPLGNAMGKGMLASGTGLLGLGVVDGVVGAVDGVLSLAPDIMGDLPDRFEALVLMLTLQHKCSFEQDRKDLAVALENRMDVVARTARLVSKELADFNERQVVDLVEGFLEQLRALRDRGLQPFRAVMSRINRFTYKFKWLETLTTIGFPRRDIRLGLFFKIPKNLVSFETFRKIMRALGRVVGIIMGPIERAIRGALPWPALPFVPSFDLDLAILDGPVQLLEQMKQRLEDVLVGHLHKLGNATAELLNVVPVEMPSCAIDPDLLQRALGLSPDEDDDGGVSEDVRRRDLASLDVPGVPRCPKRISRDEWFERSYPLSTTAVEKRACELKYERHTPVYLTSQVVGNLLRKAIHRAPRETRLGTTKTRRRQLGFLGGKVGAGSVVQRAKASLSTILKRGPMTARHTEAFDDVDKRQSKRLDIWGDGISRANGTMVYHIDTRKIPRPPKKQRGRPVNHGLGRFVEISLEEKAKGVPEKPLGKCYMQRAYNGGLEPINGDWGIKRKSLNWLWTIMGGPMRTEDLGVVSVYSNFSSEVDMDKLEVRMRIVKTLPSVLGICAHCPGLGHCERVGGARRLNDGSVKFFRTADNDYLQYIDTITGTFKDYPLRTVRLFKKVGSSYVWLDQDVAKENFVEEELYFQKGTFGFCALMSIMKEGKVKDVLGRKRTLSAVDWSFDVPSLRKEFNGPESKVLQLSDLVYFVATLCQPRVGTGKDPGALMRSHFKAFLGEYGVPCWNFDDTRATVCEGHTGKYGINYCCPTHTHRITPPGVCRLAPFLGDSTEDESDVDVDGDEGETDLSLGDYFDASPPYKPKSPGMQDHDCDPGEHCVKRLGACGDVAATPWKLKIPFSGPHVSRGEMNNLLTRSKWQVEHIFDRSQGEPAGHGFKNVVDTFSNAVMAWGVWNVDIGLKGGTDTWRAIKAEKNLVYDEKRFKAVRTVLSSCDRLHKEQLFKHISNAEQHKSRGFNRYESGFATVESSAVESFLEKCEDGDGWDKCVDGSGSAEDGVLRGTLRFMSETQSSMLEMCGVDMDTSA
ncbi:unnamed protein product [Durusdinium trenchii]|uniref:Uncharacterized protein n=1 Tax=Durusdinium trenchii TaxID=1381693 RepID=A0ABP0PLI3_9DINO